MDESRRKFLIAGAAATLFPLVGRGATASAALPPSLTPINVILPRQYAPPDTELDSGFNYRLARATLEFIQEHYENRFLPTWGKQFREIDLEKRIVNIIYWIMKGVGRYKSIYPVDPVWIVGQIMAESFFNEFAVSPAFAVGVCQFMPSTARSYGMRLYDPEQGRIPELRKYERACALNEYIELRTTWRILKRDHKVYCLSQGDQLKAVLQAVVDGLPVEDAEKHLHYLLSKDELERKMKQAGQAHIEFLKANFKDRSIFNSRDLKFLLSFDERVTYRKPVTAMVRMMAEALRARNGNILAAAAAYNAGLSRTSAAGLYKPFGRIPGIDETVAYVSRILVNHHQIVRRMNG
ncbi:MAG: transglycosylase SLT domain-containing protein [Desulfovibrionales bacterium]